MKIPNHKATWQPEHSWNDFSPEAKEEHARWRKDYNTCKCGSSDLEIRDYNPRFSDGDLYCRSCGKFVRFFDAG